MEKKKSILIGSIVAWTFLMIIVGLFIFNDYKEKSSEKYNDLQAKKESVSGQLKERDSLVNELIQSFEEISDNLERIKEQRKIISLNSQGVENGTIDKKSIINDIKALNSLLDKNKKEVLSLSKKLKNSGIEIKSLEQKIADLNETIDQRDSELLALNKILNEKDIQIASLSEHLMNLEDSLTKREMLIEQQRKDMNKAFYTIGTMKELKQRGVISMEGGVLGLGRTKVLPDNLPNEEFQEIDKSEAIFIPVYTEKAHLISEHPKDSYEFHEDEGLIAYMEILDQDKFWKMSKYMVLEVK